MAVFELPPSALLRYLTVSMLLETAQHGRKAGHVCSREYRKGPGCPLILRTTSEDALTANVFGVLRWIRPSLWLRPLLGRAFGSLRFRTCSLAGLGFSFWHPVPPPAARAHIEGSSEIDVLIKARDLAVLVEAKYQASLSTGTFHDQNRDQVIRLLDVAYELTTAGQMFTRAPYLLVLGAGAKEPELVARYRHPSEVELALAHRREHSDHASVARVLAKGLGYASWSGLAEILEAAISTASNLEKRLLVDVAAYLRLKMATVHMTSEARRQLFLPVVDAVRP